MAMNRCSVLAPVCLLARYKSITLREVKDAECYIFALISICYFDL